LFLSVSALPTDVTISTRGSIRMACDTLGHFHERPVLTSNA
jgi:hypothetical protein